MISTSLLHDSTYDMQVPCHHACLLHTHTLAVPYAHIIYYLPNWSCRYCTHTTYNMERCVNFHIDIVLSSSRTYNMYPYKYVININYNSIVNEIYIPFHCRLIFELVKHLYIYIYIYIYTVLVSFRLISVYMCLLSHPVEEDNVTIIIIILTIILLLLLCCSALLSL